MTRSIYHYLLLCLIFASGCDTTRPVVMDGGAPADSAPPVESGAGKDLRGDGQQPAPDFKGKSCFSKYKTKSACLAGGCTWKNPGCSTEPPGHLAGFCYAPPLMHCTSGACPPTHKCTDVWINPCEGLPCGACGGQSKVCLPVD